MTITETRTLRVALYLRISKDHAGDGHGVANQRADCERYVAGRPDWQVVKTFTDNDVSASSGKTRRGWDDMLAAVAAGDVDVVLCWAMDRALRTMRDYVTITELCTANSVQLCSVSGSLDFSTDQGETLGGILAVIASGEVKRKATRQRLANSEAAAAGKPRLGTPRPFGFDTDHVTHREAEADAIRWAADCLLGGGTISACMREWNARGVRPGQAIMASRELQPGEPREVQGPLRRDVWRRNSITAVLKNPRVAGLSVYKKEVVGTAAWAPILPEETWHAVVALLDDPARKPPRGVRTLLGGQAVCQCGNNQAGTHNATGKPVYRCGPETRGDRPGPHGQQLIAPVDDFVTRVMIERLSQPDLADLVTPQRADLGPLRTEKVTILRNLDELAGDRSLGLISREQLINATQRGNRRVAEIDAELAEAAGESALAPFASGTAAVTVWAGLDDSRRRAVIDALAEVVILPAGRGARVFNPDTVQINWR